jgi:hypothetical protein
MAVEAQDLPQPGEIRQASRASFRRLVASSDIDLAVRFRDCNPTMRRLSARYVDRPVRIRVRFLGVVLLVALGAGCHGQLAESLRQTTYPPSFRYIPESELRSAMWLLGHQSLELRRLLRGESESVRDPHSQIVLLLADMEQTVQQLGPDPWSSNHPQLGEGLKVLADDLRAARTAAEHDPPNYFLAGSVSGACLYCHGS